MGIAAERNSKDIQDWIQHNDTDRRKKDDQEKL
jgi:hypothetical protein